FGALATPKSNTNTENNVRFRHKTTKLHRHISEQGLPKTCLKKELKNYNLAFAILKLAMI
ncbi:MAG: hypothetical protein ACPGQP_01175, partial [Nitrosopumilus sp.]